MDKCVYVVLLNWRGWRDTIACLESLFASTGPRMRVIVCDNASGDGSLERIEEWTRGALAAEIPPHPRVAGLLGQMTRRPVCQRVDRADAEAGAIDPQSELILVDNGANLGFAAGNNVGLRLALAQADMDCVWLLNNDTLVEPDCLQEMRSALAAAGDRAVCGSMIHFFDQPDVIQAIGGNRFNRLTGTAACSEGRFLHESELQGTAQTEASLAYVSGCSMLLPRSFLEEVGLMGEDYFLYYEEIDWFTRSAGRFPIRIAADAHLYHREGSAIGSPGWQRPASSFADYHLHRSRLIFMHKHYRRFLPLCYLGGLADVAKCLLKGQFSNARAVLSVLCGRRDLVVPG